MLKGTEGSYEAKKELKIRIKIQTSPKQKGADHGTRKNERGKKKKDLVQINGHRAEGGKGSIGKSH